MCSTLKYLPQPVCDEFVNEFLLRSELVSSTTHTELIFYVYVTNVAFNKC